MKQNLYDHDDLDDHIMKTNTYCLLVTYITDRINASSINQVSKKLTNSTANIIIQCGKILSQSRTSWESTLDSMDHLPLRIKDDSIFRLWIDCLRSLLVDQKVCQKNLFIDLNMARELYEHEGKRFTRESYMAGDRFAIIKHIEKLLVSAIASKLNFYHLIALTDIFTVSDQRLIQGVYITEALDSFRQRMATRPLGDKMYVADDPTIGWNDLDSAYTASEGLTSDHRSCRYFDMLQSRLEQSWIMAVTRSAL